MRKHLFKKKYHEYSGNNPGEHLKAYCTLCKQEHDIPIAGWVLLDNHFHKVKLACLYSAKKKGYVKIDEGESEET